MPVNDLMMVQKTRGQAVARPAWVQDGCYWDKMVDGGEVAFLFNVAQIVELIKYFC